MNIKFLVAAHKQCEMPKSDVYLPVQVGKALHPDLDLGYQPDNERREYLGEILITVN